MIYAGIVLCAIVGFLAGYICGFFSWPAFFYLWIAKMADKIKGPEPDENITGGL